MQDRGERNEGRASAVSTGIKWAIGLAAVALLGATVIGLAVSLAGARGEVDRATKEIDRVAAELARKEKSLEDERAALQRVQEERDSTAQALDETRRELGNRTGELAANANALEDMEDERAELEATVQSLEQKLDDLGVAYSDISNENSSLNRTVSDLGDEGSSLRRTIRALEDTAQELSSRTEALEKERDQLTDSVKTLEYGRYSLQAAYSDLSDENGDLTETILVLDETVLALEGAVLTLEETVLTLEEEKRGLEAEIEAFRLAHESVASLEERAVGLRAVISGLENDRKALEVKSNEMFPVCTGSMEPKITCLDTVVVLENFHPEDIAVGTLISFYAPAEDEEEGDDAPPVLHRVAEIKIEEGVHYFWPKGDALEEADGYWISENSVLGYVIELRQGTRPENAALRDRVNGAQAAYVTARGTMLEARDAYDNTVIKHCGSLEAASSCETSRSNFTEITAAYNAFANAWGGYVEAICQYDEAYHHGTYDSEPKEVQSPSPYTVPSFCS